MISRLELPAGEEGWASARGELSIRHPAPGVVLFIEKGFLSSEFADYILQHSDRALREADKVHLFVDGYELDSYDPEIRNAGSAWLKKNATRVVTQHMLVRSRLTKMGLSVVSLALGGLIKGHHERLAFEADLAAAIRIARGSGRPLTK
jgi:hypothetical protein